MPNDTAPQSHRFEQYTTAELQRLLPLRRHGSSVVLYLLLKLYAGQRDVCWPSGERLAVALAMSTSQVSQSLKVLEDAGLVERQYDNGHRVFFLPLHRRQFSSTYIAKDPIEPEVNSGCSHDEKPLPNEQESKNKSHTSSRSKRNKPTSTHTRQARKLVEMIVASRKLWLPGYTTQEVKDRATRSCANLLANGEINLEDLTTVVEWSCKNYFPNADINFVYMVTNVFGQKKHWQKLVEMYRQATRNRDTEPGESGGWLI